MRLIFRPKSEIQTFFLPKIRWSPKTIETDFTAEIFKRFFCPKSGGLQKKRSSPKLRLIFWPNSEIQTFEGGCFPMGGLFSIFHKKSASKAPKMCDFAFFTSQWGARAPPAPPWLRYWYQGLMWFYLCILFLTSTRLQNLIDYLLTVRYGFTRPSLKTCFYRLLQTTVAYTCFAEVESSKTSLASRTHFEVLGLKASSPRKLACTRLEDSTTGIFCIVEILWSACKIF